MPADPIPIGSKAPTQPMPISNSPPQPFAGSAVGLSTSTPGASLFGKWNAFGGGASNKSPTNANVSVKPVASSPPTQKVDIPRSGSQHEEHDRFDHDNLEFGGGWAAAAAARGQQRAVSMSLSPTTTMGNQIASSPLTTGVLNDKMAYGNGVLRRLSLSSGFGKVCIRAGRPSWAINLEEDVIANKFQPAVPPPPVPNPPNPTPIGSVPKMQPQGLAAHPPPPADTTPRNVATQARRRFSESGARKRGVSPVSTPWSMTFRVHS